MAKLPSDEEINVYAVTLDTYCTALGKVAHAWNHMQEELGKLFCLLCDMNLSLGMTIWHSLRSDLAQRQMLRAVVEFRGSDDGWVELHPEAKETIVALVNGINEFSNKRNAAIHAPCRPVLGGDDLEIIAVSFFGNPNAQKLDEQVLNGHDILVQFDWFERTAEAYRDHIMDVEAALTEPRLPWPGKRRMPHLGEKNNPQGHRPAQT
jgi:hypothetical protein